MVNIAQKSKTHVCKICGREFGSHQALAGHIATHTQGERNNGPRPQGLAQIGGTGTGEVQSGVINGPGFAEEQPGPSTGAQDTGDVEESSAETPSEQPSETQEAEAYAKQGYSMQERVNLLGFSKSTARSALSKVVRPESEPQDNGHDRLPAYRSVGSGQQMLNPEPMLE